MEEPTTKRWYASNETGRQEFYIEIQECEGVGGYLFESSLPFLIYKDSEIALLVLKISRTKISKYERDQIAEILIKRIKLLPGIRRFYFPNGVLDEREKYCEAYANTLAELLIHPDIKEYTPYTNNINEFLFQRFTKEFVYEEEKGICIAVDKSCFEELINGHFELQQAYAEVYYSDAEYYFDSVEYENKLIEYYFAVANKKLILIFFTFVTENRLT